MVSPLSRCEAREARDAPSESGRAGDGLETQLAMTFKDLEEDSMHLLNAWTANLSEVSPLTTGNDGFMVRQSQLCRLTATAAQQPQLLNLVIADIALAQKHQHSHHKGWLYEIVPLGRVSPKYIQFPV
eukprot:s3910_g2.t1